VTTIEVKDFSTHLIANRRVGVPYSDDMIAHARDDIMAQADPNADTSHLEGRYPKAKLGDFDGNPQQVTEMDALVAYLQMLGTLVDFKTYDEAAGYR
ncbi:MAG: cytochrome-c oxidase, cbb3-type subunit II, partial [Mesorhizobium sp.]